jgi:hypothetical protein
LASGLRVGQTKACSFTRLLFAVLQGSFWWCHSCGIFTRQPARAICINRQNCQTMGSIDRSFIWYFQESFTLGFCVGILARWPSSCFSILRPYSQAVGSVAGSPKVHNHDCLIRLHTMTSLLDFTRCSPSCSSYLRRSFVCLSCAYHQLTYSLQQVMSLAVATD